MPHPITLPRLTAEQRFWMTQRAAGAREATSMCERILADLKAFKALRKSKLIRQPVKRGGG